ncbi:MAG: LysR family transcriptional regulator [Faecousia sp.]
MDISYFQEFIILSETKNYWAAADRLFIGQSSLSKHIKALEKHLGAPLFDRNSRKVELTEFGRMMLPYAQSISKLQHEYQTTAYNYLHVGIQNLRIASIPAMAQYDITDTLLNFQLECPSVQIYTMEDDSFIIREALINNKCDLAFLRDSELYVEHDPDKEVQLVKLQFCQDKLVAVLPHNHPLAGADHLELSQLANENFALIKQGSMPYKLCIRACESAGFSPHVIFSSHHIDGILDMVTKGNCVALLFSNHVEYPIDSVLSIAPPFAVVPIEPEIWTTIYLAYLKSKPLSPAASRFVEHCIHTKAINSK